VLTGEPEGAFSKSYVTLRPYLRWYEWGGSSITQVITRPAQMGADMSPLTRILDDETHKDKVELSREERRRIYIWLDGNAPFYGAYEKSAQLAQQNGKAILPPRIQ
jgi:hypothetical protein